MRGDGPYTAIYPDFFAAVGARYHFAEGATLNLRAGVPFVSAGVSLFAF